MQASGSPGNGIEERLEDPAGIVGSRSGFRVKLGAFDVTSLVINALDGVVVGVAKPNSHVARQRGLVHRETMVLAGDKNFARQLVSHGMVHSMVAELHFVGFGAQGEANQLMAQANPEHGNDVEKALDKRNLVGEHGRVTGTGRI